ncbi:Crp/Fnr family transcriptional regulator [Myroides albus]|uniref:Cyclic nucleotide-binding domain-containing protein n=1 Tax=Myroides albus TaxID=2562892 RepID=A0A6I3LK83_9FLAO|nr:Crp/Fnr family transcriptional regulator [Myroides albus]MTG97650.1 cyclic nucleotide-binding domain-containing protein [Myroides albus]UVD79279.1 Crp/Fnr family transcriptional regulator [Myroides albus]
MSKEFLFKHIQKFIPFISQSEVEQIYTYFTELNLKKKEIVQHEEELCRSMLFVCKGCLHSYYIKDNGSLQTLDFAIESWWICDYMAFENSSLSDLTIQAVETSIVLSLSRESLDALLQHHPVMEQYFRRIFQRSYAAAQKRVQFLYQYSREELYFHFASHYPEFVQRVPQYLLASYLGFTPEYLSEIKKNSLR